MSKASEYLEEQLQEAQRQQLRNDLSTVQRQVLETRISGLTRMINDAEQEEQDD